MEKVYKVNMLAGKFTQGLYLYLDNNIRVSILKNI